MAASRPARPSKAQLPALDTGPVRLVGLRDAARKQLLDAVDSKRGKKALILDPTVSGPLSLLDGSLSEALSEHGVMKLLHLEKKGLDDIAYNQAEPRLSDIRTIIYMVRATVENAQMVAAQIKAAVKGPTHDFAVFFVPRRTIACEKVLEEAGVLGDAVVGELQLELIPFEDDVLSLELESALKECILEGDTTPLFYVARAVMQLQRHFGLIPRIQGKGPAAESVKKIMAHMRREEGGSLGKGANKIDRLVLLDRDVDMATPMCTQITFEGLIDEVTGIKCGSVPWSGRDRRADGAESSSAGASTSASASTSSSRPAKGTILLNSTDPFYKEFRDLPYYVTSSRLQQYARDARKEYAELSSKDISDLKTFVKGLPKVMMLDRLSDVAAPVAEQVRQQLFHDRLRWEQDILENYGLDEAVEFVEELMCRGRGVVEVLRLMVLLAIANNGIPRRHYDALRTQLLQTYGPHHLVNLNSLEKCGLLKVQTSGKGAWATVRKAFNLIISEEDQPGDAPPTDIAYLYKGYAPLSIRLLEHALKGSWSAVSEALYLLPGGHFDVVQGEDEHGVPVEKAYKGPAVGAGGGAGQAVAEAALKPEVVAVVFIGGVTYSEIAAVRLLASFPGFQHFQFLVITTKIVNGRTLLTSFMDPIFKDSPE